MPTTFNRRSPIHAIRFIRCDDREVYGKFLRWLDSVKIKHSATGIAHGGAEHTFQTDDVEHVDKWLCENGFEEVEGIAGENS